MTARVIIMLTSRNGQSPKMLRAFLPANPGGIRKPVGVSVSTTAEGDACLAYRARRCAAKAFKKLNGGDVDEIETRVKIEKHPQPETWLAVLTK